MKTNRLFVIGATQLLLWLLASAPPAFAQLAGTVAKTPPMGWNSWNHFAGNVNDAAIRAEADALVSSELKAAGYIYVNVDDGWAGKRDAEGHIHPNSKFPDMKRLADYVHSKGLKFGLYTAANQKTCLGLNGSANYEKQDARTYAEWGVDYLKVDWCRDNFDWFRGDDSQVSLRFKKMGDALRSTGRSIVYSISAPGPAWQWGAQVGGNLWRTSIDIKDNWDRMSNNGFNENGLEKFAGPGHWNDPDMLEVGNDGSDNNARDATLVQAPIYRKGMSEDEYRTHMSLWCLLAAPLIIGADIAKLKPADLAILSNPEVIAVDQDPLGKQGVRLTEEGPLDVWIKPLADGSRAVGLFNRGLGPAQIAVTFKKMGIGSNASVRNLWTRRNLGQYSGQFSAKVNGHGVVLIKVR